MKRLALHAVMSPTLALKPALRGSRGDQVPGTKDGLRNAKFFPHGKSGLRGTLPGQGYWRPMGLTVATSVAPCRRRRSRPAHHAGKLAAFRSASCSS
jgi:hypothetical protein